MPKAPARKTAPKLSHVGRNSRARMVDVTDKAETVREAKASGRMTSRRPQWPSSRRAASRRGR